MTSGPFADPLSPYDGGATKRLAQAIIWHKCPPQGSSQEYREIECGELPIERKQPVAVTGPRELVHEKRESLQWCGKQSTQSGSSTTAAAVSA
jgi:hypothetical protein